MLPHRPRLYAVACWALAAVLPACDREGPAPSQAPSRSGAALFAAYCAACHHPEGLGTPGGPPPLADSPWVAGPEGRLIRIVLHGVRGAIEVAGRTYNLEMPGFGPILSDADVAAVLTHVRDRFGGGAPPVSPESVARIRDATRERFGYWTAAELLELR